MSAPFSIRFASYQRPQVLESGILFPLPSAGSPCSAPLPIDLGLQARGRCTVQPRGHCPGGEDALSQQSQCEGPMLRAEGRWEIEA